MDGPKGEGGVENCEKIDDAKEIKGVDKDEGGRGKKIRKTGDVVYGRPQIALWSHGFDTCVSARAICPTSKTKVGQLLRIAEFCF